MKIRNFIKHKTLTPSQEITCDKLEEFILDNGLNIFMLKGYAGTGKTTLLDGFTKLLNAKELKFSLLAPTGRAAKILREKTGEGSTIHTHIYNLKELKEYEDKSVVKETFKFFFDLDISGGNQFLIIDEASMVSNVYSESEFFRFGSGHLLNDLMKFSALANQHKNHKIIFVGDNAQLPPVGMNYSPAITDDYYNKSNLLFDEVEMTDVIRQNLQSGILKNATIIRDLIKNKSFNSFKIEDDIDVLKLRQSDVVDKYFEITNGKVSEKSIVIAYSNTLVKDYNLDIRKKYFPDNEYLCKGDLLQSVANRYSDVFNLMNGDFVKVHEVGERESRRAIYNRGEEKGGIINVQLNFIDVLIIISDTIYKVKLLEDLLYSHDRDVRPEVMKALFVDFKSRHKGISPKSKLFKDLLKKDIYFNAVRAKFGYAITCHKSQGGEWNNVIVDFERSQGKRNEDFHRWAYTAITRATDRLWHVNAPELTSFDKVRVDKISVSNKLVRKNISSDNTEYLSDFHEEKASQFLKEKFNIIISQVNNYCNIYSVTSLPYRERYVFEKDGKFVQVDFLYNGKDVFNPPTIKGVPAESLIEIKEKLSTAVSLNKKDFIYQPSTKVYERMYSKLSDILGEKQIIQVDEYPEGYYVRYFVKSDCDESYFQVYFKENGTISYIKPSCTSIDSSFVSIIEKLKEELSL